MKFNIIVITLFSLILSANIYIYLQKHLLLKEIDKADNECARELAATEQQYLKQINKLSLQLDVQYDAVDINKTQIKSNLDDIVSYGHLLGAVSHKYEFLLHTAKLPENDKKELINFLIEREKLNSVTFQSLAETNDEERANFASKLTSIEESIKNILIDQVDYQRYEYLKDRRL
ncbi:MAG: hypothetical protein PVI97_10680 [Candidatus Thiodiazotropha sp.]|jgi:hypothetical protein